DGQLPLLAGRQVLDVAHQGQHGGGDRLGNVEDVVVGLVERRVEDGGGAAGALHERVAVPGGYRGGGGGEQRRVRPEGQVDLVLANERLVVGHHLGRRAVVIEYVELYLAS